MRHHDRSALLLTPRLPEAMPVPVALGPVSGTLLTFEIGVPWPGLMGPFGPAFGIPFAVEGIFFFLGAVLTAVYLRPAWPAGK